MRFCSQGVIALERLMSFTISTILWLNKKAAPRITSAFQAAAGPDGTLNYDEFKTGLHQLIAWNEPTTVRDATQLLNSYNTEQFPGGTVFMAHHHSDSSRCNFADSFLQWAYGMHQRLDWMFLL